MNKQKEERCDICDCLPEYRVDYYLEVCQECKNFWQWTNQKWFERVRMGAISRRKRKANY